MSYWWYVLAAIVIVAVVAYVVMRSRTANVTRPDADTPARDYRDERESSRLNGMSDEDRAWEAASRERSQSAQPTDQPPPKQG